MKHSIDVKLLRFIAEALQKPMPKRERGLYDCVVRNAARDGWVSFADIEDIICETDPRLYSLDISAYADAAAIPARYFYPRPRAKDTQVFGVKGLPTADAAALLISLRRLGFSVDAKPLVDLVMPLLKAQRNLSEAELSVFWFYKEHENFRGFTVQGGEERPRRLDILNFVTETGHRVELCTNQDGDPWLLTVQPPKKVKTKPLAEKL